MKRFLFIALCFFFYSCSNQRDDSFIVSLDTIYNQSGRGFLILYPISEMDKNLYDKIIFPDLSEVADTVFAKIYFTGKNYSALENEVLTLVGEYKSEVPKIWIDYNNNLDFSEVVDPLLFNDEFIDIIIPNVDKPELFHGVRFYKVEPSQKTQYIEMIDQFITGGNPYSDFWFDQRRNIKVGDFVFKKDSLRIGLMDWNVNGAYDDLNIDMIVIGEYGGEIRGKDQASGAILLDSTTYFQGTSYAFEVINVAPDGSSITIKPTLSSNIESVITVGHSVPDYSFKLLSGEKTSLHKFLNGNNYVYLNFWATWCGGCHQEIDDLKRIYNDYSDKVIIVSLNYNEDTEKIESFLDKYQVSWLNGHSTQEIKKELFVVGLPRNILIDPLGKVVKMDISPSLLLSRIEQLGVDL